MGKSNAVQDSLGDRLFMVGVYTFLVGILIIVIYPLIFIFSSSFSSPQAVSEGRVWLYPVEFSLMGYKTIFESPNILTGFLNSLFYTCFGVLINVAFTLMIAYPLSLTTFYGKNVLTFLLIFTIMFSGGLVPTFLTVKALGIIDTRWSLLLIDALIVWQVIIARTFFQTTIPREMKDAAELDGCGDLGFLWRIVLPLSKPAIAVLVLMYAVGHWNSYFNAMIYLKTQSLFPLQIFLREILILNTPDTSMMVNATEMAARQGLRDLLKYSLIVVASVPILLIYPLIQKHFVKGMLIGSLKG